MGYPSEFYVYGHISLSIIIFIVGLIELNWVMTFYKLYNHLNIDGLIARSPKSVFVTGLLISLAHLILAPYNSLNKIFTNYWVFELISQLLTLILYLPPPIIILCRTFTIHYTIKYHIKLESNEWTKIITLSSKKLDKSSKFYHNFIQKNKIYYIMFTFYIIIALLYMTTWLLSNIGDTIIPQWIPSTLLVVQTLPTIIGLSIFMIILPKYQDIFHIRNETKFVAIHWVIWTVITGTVLYAIKDNHLRTFISNIAGIPIGFGLLVIILFFPLKQLGLPKCFWNIKKYMNTFNLEKSFDTATTLTDRDRTGSAIENEPKISKKKPKLINIWSDKEILRAYAQHCLKEFSIENILFLIESNQFNNVLYNMYHNNDDSNTKNNTLQLTRFECKKFIPKSAIVDGINTTDINEVNTKYNAFVMLLRKYILFGSQYEINISSKTRDKLYKIFGLSIHDFNIISKYDKEWFINKLNNNNIDIKGLCFIFDRCIREIYKLSSDVYRRFTYSDEFARYIQINIIK